MTRSCCAQDWRNLRLDLTDLAKLLLSILSGDWRGNDDIVTGEPVDGAGNAVLVGGLEGINHTENLGGVTASGGGVGHDQTDLLGRVNNENGTDSESDALLVDVGSVLVVNHIVQVGNLAAGVGNDGEGELGAIDLVDVLDPGLVGVGAIGALAECQRTYSCLGNPWIQLTRPISLTLRAANSGSSLAKAPSSVVQTGVKSSYSIRDQPSFFQSSGLFLHAAIWEIGGTNRVGKEDSPAVANELVEGDRTIGGISFEVRGSRAETETVG